jgi:hypothetical protein
MRKNLPSPLLPDLQFDLVAMGVFFDSLYTQRERTPPSTNEGLGRGCTVLADLE